MIKSYWLIISIGVFIFLNFNLVLSNYEETNEDAAYWDSSVSKAFINGNYYDITKVELKEFNNTKMHTSVDKPIAQPNNFVFSKVYPGSLAEGTFVVYASNINIVSKPDWISIIKITKISSSAGYERHIVLFRIDTSNAGEFNGDINIATERGDANFGVSIEILSNPKMPILNVLVSDTPYEAFSGPTSFYELNRVAEMHNISFNYHYHGFGDTGSSLPALQQYDMLILGEDALASITPEEVLMVRDFLNKDKKLIIAADSIYLGTIAGANLILDGRGLRFLEGYYTLNRFLQSSYIINDPFTENVFMVYFTKASLISAQPEKATLLVKYTLADLTKGLVAVERDNAKILSLGSSLWWNWIEYPDNNVMFENFLLLESPNIIIEDVNRDCRVNILDLILVRNKIGESINKEDNWKADVNQDSVINILDLILVRNKLNSVC